MRSHIKYGYIVVLISILLAPLSEFFWKPLSRGQVLRSAHRTFNFSPYLNKLLFEETTPIDVAIFGSSHVRGGIDASLLQRLLSQRLDRVVSVTHVPIVAPGPELQEFVAEVLLERRRVNLMLFDVDINPITAPNHSTCFIMFLPHWWESMVKLPFFSFMKYYSCAIVAFPRLLMNYFDPRSGIIFQKNPTEYDDQLGGMTFGEDKDVDSIKFDSMRTEIDQIPIHNLVRDTSDSDQLTLVEGAGYTQPIFIEKFGALGKRYNTRVAVVRFVYSGQGGAKLLFSQEAINSMRIHNLSVIGPSPSTLQKIAGISKLEELFFDGYHLNGLGRAVMTMSIYRPIAELLRD
jgi:hypothetical protein